MIRDNLIAFMGKYASKAETLVNGLNALANEFDINEQFKELSEMKKQIVEKSNGILKDFGKMFDKVKDNLQDFSITVPYDEDKGEHLEQTIVGDTITVIVSSNDGNVSKKNMASATIPSNCDVSKINVSVNKISKTATVSIPKVLDMASEANDAEVKQEQGDAARSEAEAEPKVKEVKPKRKKTAKTVTKKVFKPLKPNAEKQD